MKTSELTGVMLDYWVAAAYGCSFKPSGFGDRLLYATVDRPMEWLWLEMFNPSTEWAHGGPIIERERINIICSDFHGPEQLWTADCGAYGHYIDAGLPGLDGDGFTGPTPLVAAMRAYVVSKFGEDVADEVAA